MHSQLDYINSYRESSSTIASIYLFVFAWITINYRNIFSSAKHTLTQKKITSSWIEAFKIWTQTFHFCLCWCDEMFSFCHVDGCLSLGMKTMKWYFILVLVGSVFVIVTRELISCNRNFNRHGQQNPRMNHNEPHSYDGECVCAYVWFKIIKSCFLSRNFHKFNVYVSDLWIDWARFGRTMIFVWFTSYLHCCQLFRFLCSSTEMSKSYLLTVFLLLLLFLVEKYIRLQKKIGL